jgi:hypothetical protein
LANWSGQRWPDGATGFSTFNTILPPNGPTCCNHAWDGDRFLQPPTSYHSGGVNLMNMDCSVTFVNDSIATGNLAARPVRAGMSPYGPWGAKGSQNGGDVSTN